MSSVINRRPPAAAAAPCLVGDRLAVVPLTEKRDSLAVDMAASGRPEGSSGAAARRRGAVTAWAPCARRLAYDPQTTRCGW